MNFKSYRIIILTNDIKNSDTINCFCSNDFLDDINMSLVVIDECSHLIIYKV